MNVRKRILIAFFSVTSIFTFAEAKNLSLFYLDGKYGLVNNNLDVEIQPEYENIEITPDYYVFKNTGDGKTYIYNKELRLIYNPYRYWFIRPVSESTCMIAEGFDNIVLVDTETGRTKRIDVTENVKWPYGSDKNRYASGWYYLTDDFKSRSLEKGDFLRTYPFVNNRAVVMKKAPDGYGGVVYEVINEEGKTVLGKIKDCAGYYTEGLLAVEMMDGTSGFVDEEGEIVFPCDFDVPLAKRNPDPCIYFHFNEGLSIVKSDKDFKWRIFNKDGSYVNFPEEYETECFAFKEGLIPVYKIVNGEKKYGYMNKQLRIVIPAVLQKASQFINGYAMVRFKDKDGIMDKKGNIYLSETLVSEDKTIFRNATHY